MRILGEAARWRPGGGAGSRRRGGAPVRRGESRGGGSVGQPEAESRSPHHHTPQHKADKTSNGRCLKLDQLILFIIIIFRTLA